MYVLRADRRRRRRYRTAPRKPHRIRRLVMLALAAWFAVTLISTIHQANVMSSQYRPETPAPVTSTAPAGSTGKAASHVRIPHPHHVPGGYIARQAYYGSRNRNPN